MMLDPSLLKIMGCFIWFTTIVIIVITSISLIKSCMYQEDKRFFGGAIIFIISVLIIGTSIGLLFHQVAALVAK